MTAILAPPLRFRGVDNFGLALVGGQLSSFIAGTSTPQATYVDSTQTTQNANPIILDARGECNLWLDPTKIYKFALTDQFGNPVWTQDQVQGSLTAAALTQAFLGSILYPQTAAEIAAGVSPINYGYAALNPYRYGADGLGGANDATALARVQLVLTQLYPAAPPATGINTWLNGMAAAGVPQTSQEAAAAIVPTFYINKFVPTPKRYGAAGDGVTNDTAALQRWINSTANDLELDDLTYLSSGLNISRAGVRIYGNGQNSILKITGAVGSCGLQFVTAGQVGVPGGAAAATHFGAGFIGRDFRIQCVASANQIYGIWCNNAEITSLENVTIDLTGNTFAGAVRNATYGLLGYFQQDGTFRKCTFTSGAGANSDGIILTGTLASNISSNNNLFEACRAQSCGGYGVRNVIGDGNVWIGGKLQNNTTGGWIESDDGLGNGPSNTFLSGTAFEVNSGDDIRVQNGNHLIVRDSAFESTTATNHINHTFGNNSVYDNNLSFPGKPVIISGGSNVRWNSNNLSFGTRTFTDGVLQREPVTALTFAASIATDASQGDLYRVTATSNTAITFTTPTNTSLGQRLRYEVINNSGGAMGAVAFSAAFLLVGAAAFVSPASGKRRVIEFYYPVSGLNQFVEVTRSTADI